MTHSATPLLSVSVVSHGQMALVEALLNDIQQHCQSTNLELILTLNETEVWQVDLDRYSFPVTLIQNVRPQGFGANHNQAFQAAKGQFFCVLNPDVRLPTNPFVHLLPVLQQPDVGVCAPRVVDGSGLVEDNARRFPSPYAIVCKALGVKRDAAVADPHAPDWVAGLFMLFRSETFARLKGFDARYFLYYEDVDLCARLSLSGLRVALSPAVTVVHLAQRTSHHSFRYFRWHVASMLKFFLSGCYWRLIWRS
jgi:N-acetylglucosaminyl-diphospho-decaprenol L-rhamnosyltransferase